MSRLPILCLLVFVLAIAGCQGPTPEAVAKMSNDELVSSYIRWNSISGTQGTKNITAEIESRKMFTEEELESIRERSVFLGMSEQAAVMSWGPAEDSTTILTSGGRTTIYYFPGGTVWVRNGRVTDAAR